MINRLRDFWDNVKRIFFLIVILFGIAILTIALISPDNIKQFIESISVILRVLFLVVLYGVFGFYAYTILSGRQEERGIDGLVSRVGGNVTGISTDVAQAQINKALREIGGIKALDVDVVERRGRAFIKVTIVFSEANINIIQKQNEVRRRLDQVVKKQLGVSYAEDPVIGLNVQGGAMPKMMPEQKSATSSSNDDDNPEWQAILKSSQPPAEDNK
ncbi:MAG: hypothetical protein SFZ02_11540 [bacterium]|nr:hypothetical protein [bacterium]